MIEEAPPRLVDRGAVRALAAFAERTLREQLATCRELPAISAETRKGIARRVPPRSVAEYSKVEKLPVLINMELEALGDRIRLYPFIAQYRESLNSASRDMMVAWQMHSHSLRQSELYIIQERSVDLLRFLRSVVTNLGVPAPDRSKTFGKAFKKKFEHRLRERHRLVHAHERPSLTSRVIELGTAASETDKDRAASALGDLLVKIALMLPGEETNDPLELLRRVRSLVDSYVVIAQQEATDMLELLSIEVGAILGAPSKAVPVS